MEIPKKAIDSVGASSQVTPLKGWWVFLCFLGGTVGHTFCTVHPAPAAAKLRRCAKLKRSWPLGDPGATAKTMQKTMPKRSNKRGAISVA